MSIKISKRIILDSDGIDQISVSYERTCLSICSGYDSNNTGHIVFDAKQLSELINVLQIFIKERGES
tara:strand:+ start:220 stop:420 length:201 start_codon:yes stop_codon:yes gene_type:complete